MVELWKNEKAWLIIIGLGVVVGVADASQQYLLLGVLGRPIPLWRALLMNVSYWMTFAALVPAVVFLASRYRLDGPLRWRRFAIHTVAAVGFVLAHFSSAALVVLTHPDIDQTPTVRFLNLLRNYSAGNFLQYWAIVGAFYAVHYYEQARTKELQAAHLQAVLTRSQLQALKSQLNPHFLFNTLNTIFVLAKKGDQTAVAQTLSRLSHLIRASMDETRPSEIRLAEELAFLDTYLEIQRTRFSDRLCVEYHIGPETREALVPSMILQPLLENAVRYGVSSQVGKAKIAIRAVRDGDMLNLEVSDNGPGFASRSRDVSRVGIGLANTEARLQYLYGERQVIRYSANDVPGAVVAISLPFRTDREALAG